MNKLNFILPLAMVTLMSCSNDSQGIELKGKLQNSSKSMIAIDVLNINGVKALDSVITNDVGEFVLKFEPKEISFYRLRTHVSGSYLIMCMNINEKVSLKGDANSLQGTAVITGSPETQKMQDVNLVMRRNQQRGDSLNVIYQRYANTPTQDSIVPILQAEYQNIQTNELKFLKKYIVENANSITSLTFIDKLDKDKEFATYKKLDEGLTKAYPTNVYVTDFHKRVAEMSKLMEGSPAPDFTLSTPEGQKLSLSSFRGKIVLVDFWASWCGPCRKENPNVVKVYKEYHQKGFEILSVSLDKSKEKWVEAIAHDGLTWNHVSDLGFWQSAVVPLYSITGIPLTILVDRDGNIAAKGLRGAELESKISELINKK